MLFLYANLKTEKGEKMNTLKYLTETKGNETNDSLNT